MDKFYFVFDKTSRKANKLEKKIIQKFKNYPVKNSDCIVVCGGDGFMLNSLKKFSKFNKPFYGINCGTFGFLLNDFSIKDLKKKINKSKKIFINPLQLTCVDKSNNIKKLIAINEVSLFRQSRQTSILKIKINKKILLKKFIGDGVLVSTPAGSTAYNLSVHGPILTLNSGKIAITPISAFRPRRWKGKVISNKMTVKINNLDVNKRPVAVVADNIEIRKVKSIKVKVNKNINISLLYNNRSLINKIKNEQLKIK